MTMNLPRNCRFKTPCRAVRLWWLGQAGLPSSSCRPDCVCRSLLSDAVERLHGFKALVAVADRRRRRQADLIVLSHEHTDHLIPDALR